MRWQTHRDRRWTFIPLLAKDNHTFFKQGKSKGKMIRIIYGSLVVGTAIIFVPRINLKVRRLDMTSIHEYGSYD
jgi:hypothetical protein